MMLEAKNVRCRDPRRVAAKVVSVKKKLHQIESMRKISYKSLERKCMQAEECRRKEESGRSSKTRRESRTILEEYLLAHLRLRGERSSKIKRWR